MQHHHIDEFSVTDVRHTLNEMLRVISARRWYLVFPFCLVTALAFLCSLWMPRQYTTTTVIKREHDPVFANLMGKNWTGPYQNIHDRMPTQIKEKELIEEVLASYAFPGELMQTGVTVPGAIHGQSERGLVNRIVSGLSVSTIESTEHRDIVKISLKMNEPTNMVGILRRVRDAYMKRARQQTVEILENAAQFLQSESDRCKEELELLNERLVEYELKYPGISPNSVDPATAEKGALLVERVDSEKKLDDLAFRREHLETEFARLVGMEDEDADSTMLEEANPRYSELLEEIQQLEEKIAEGKAMRSMTEAHPEIQRIRALLAVRQEALARTPATLTVSARVAGARAVNFEAVDQLRRKLVENESNSTAIKSRLQDIQLRLRALNDHRALVIGHRQDYAKLKNEADRLSRELATWQKNIAPVQQVMNLEDKDRSIHFTTVQEATPVLKPSSPDSRLVMMFCLGIGLASAVLSVLLVELVDRSYRSAKQLTTSLGIPVIESIDEIITKVIYRRRLIRNLVVMPTLAVVMVTAMVLAGAMAYWNLENPAKLESMKMSPKRVYELVIGWS